MRTLLITLLILGSMLPMAPTASADRVDDAAAVGLDVLVLRPVGALTCLVGGAFFVPVYVISYPNGKAGREQARERFITIPWETTFERDLGDW